MTSQHIESPHPMPSQEMENAILKKEIPEHELRIVFARGSGPGGQKRNKTATKTTVFWKFSESLEFTEEEKNVIAEKLTSKINTLGELFVTNDVTRSQNQNRQAAIETMNTLVSDALLPEIERVPTKPSHSQKARRLDDKTQQKRKKESRQKHRDE